MAPEISNANPGPGHYNIANSWPKRSYSTPVVECYFKGAESCSECGQLLFGDYYKSTSGRLCLCLTCYRKICDPIRQTPCCMHKVRHCITYHIHIGVENILCHRATSKSIRRLNLMEKVMWNKFGEVLDHKGKPI